MIRIGGFARLSQVSIATLRHYDDIGLLKPAAIDGFTGYRYYTAGQLARLHRILALKDLGFSLPQIEAALSDGLTPDQLRGMLKLRRAEAERRLVDDQERLLRIEARLRHIEQEDSMPHYDVVLKTVPPLLVASRRVRIPTNDRVPDYLGPAFAEVQDYVLKNGLRKTGPSLAIWHSPADVFMDEDAEAAVPVDRLLPSTERVVVHEVPETQVASAVHHGNFDEFTQAHVAVLTWIETSGSRVAGPYREVYVDCGDSDPAGSTTEVQFPVDRA